MKRWSVVLTLSLLALSVQTLSSAAAERPAESSPAAAEGPLAPLLEGMGDHQRPLTTEDPVARRYFHQGLALAYGFNHGEAERSFREAAQRDPGCALCFWGAALVLGPNINAAMEDDAVPAAWAALQQALALSPGASPVEQALIAALARRYAPEPVADRSALDQAYAAAMREVARRFPEDPDAATLLAEALMDLHPWDYWQQPSGEPQPWTGEILSTLEAALAKNPSHPGANHLYIHAVEASRQPERGIPAADRLGGLVPGAGHMVHMPSHIYLRVGRYADASEANEKAIAADDSYITQCHAQGLYPVAYRPHNHHFLWAAATLEGRGERALAAARHMAAHTDGELMRQAGYGTLQHYWVTPLYALARFGRWEEILATAAPPADLVYPTGVWHYARGLAQTRSGQLEEAAVSLAALRAAGADPALEGVTIWDINTTADLLAIAAEVLAGELAAARGRHGEAAAHLREGVGREDALRYDEPPPWHAPVRQSLGAVLLAAGKPGEAEAVYREDLERVPENGWSLFGLAASLRAQGREEEARQVEARFRQAWARADVQLASSRF